MKVTLFWALTVLSNSNFVLADATKTASASPTCTASLITTLCDYPEPAPGTAVAASGEDSCWDYCNAHQPCSFFIFVPHNPHLGDGTCWLYPGETFDESKGSKSGCGSPYLSVFNKPECHGGSAPTATSDGACAATETPFAIASVCGYPPPDEECFNDCYAAEGASECLSICAEKGCSYAVFNPHNENGSQYLSGTCWAYPKGTYDAGSAGTCSGGPEQFVYKNLCPKPPPPTSTKSAPKKTESADADSDAGGSQNGDGTPSATPSGKAGSGKGGNDSSSGSGSGSDGDKDGNDSDSGSGGVKDAAGMAASTTGTHNSAPSGLSGRYALAVGVAGMAWQGF